MISHLSYECGYKSSIVQQFAFIQRYQKKKENSYYFDKFDKIQRCMQLPHLFREHFKTHHIPDRASLIAQLVKNPPAMQETPVRFLGQEDPLENG